MSLFARKPTAEPRIQSLGEMIAYSLTSEVTRASWATRRKEHNLENKALGITIEGNYPRSNWPSTVMCRGKIVPLTGRDESKLSNAMAEWRKWNDEARRAEAMVGFVDAFERVAASAGEAGTAGTTKIGPVHEPAAPKGGDAQ